MTIIEFIILVVAFIALFYSGGTLVRQLTWFGLYFGLSEYALSFILVAFATSLPELFVGISSAVRGEPLLSLGNLIGANVLNVTWVVGVAALLAGRLEIGRVITKEDLQLILGVLFLPILLLLDGIISRQDGLILLFFFGGYLIYLINKDHTDRALGSLSVQDFSFSNFMKKLGYFGLGTLLLLLSSYFVVSGALAAANHFLLPIFFVGIIVSLGTTLPETVFSARSVLMRHGSMSLGNALGSVVVNILLVLGLVAVISPIEPVNISRSFFGLTLTVGLVVTLQLIGLLRGFIGRVWGIFLILTALGFILIVGAI